MRCRFVEDPRIVIGLFTHGLTTRLQNEVLKSCTSEVDEAYRIVEHMERPGDDAPVTTTVHPLHFAKYDRSPRHICAPLRTGPDTFILRCCVSGSDCRLKVVSPVRMSVCYLPSWSSFRSPSPPRLRIHLRRDAAIAEDYYRYPSVPRTNDFPRHDRPGSRPAG